MREIIAKAGEELCLGKRGEKNAVCVRFDIADWLSLYGDGDIHLIYQRNGDTFPYPCVIDRCENAVKWVITNTETDKAGRGKAELQLVQDGVIVKSDTFVTRVMQSLAPPTEEAPEVGQAWIDKVLEVGKLSSVVVTETATEVTFISTFVDGTTKVRVITKGADGNPAGMTDDGRVVEVSWTEVD